MPTLFVFLILVVMALISHYTSVSSTISFGIGVGLGLALMVLVVRKIGKRAYRSPLCREIVFNITAYRPKQQPIKEQAIKEQVIQMTTDDYKELKEVLRDKMKFTPVETKEALDFVENNIPNATLEVKIKEALRYLGNGHKELVGDK